jgi:hypothetical protein
MEKLYKIQEYSTTGWEDVSEPMCRKLTKEQCSIRIEELLAEGYNPNRLQAIPDA